MDKFLLFIVVFTAIIAITYLSETSWDKKELKSRREKAQKFYDNISKKQDEVHDVRLWFKGRIIGDPELALDTVTFKLKNGDEVVIDRHITEFSIEDDNTFMMEWIQPYIWDGENCIDISSIDILDGAELISYHVDEDMPEGYNIIINQFEVFV